MDTNTTGDTDREEEEIRGVTIGLDTGTATA